MKKLMAAILAVLFLAGCSGLGVKWTGEVEGPNGKIGSSTGEVQTQVNK